MKTVEICNECGRSVKFGSGRFINRVIDANGYETRLTDNKPFPQGDFICPECELELNRLTEKYSAYSKRKTD